MAIRGAFRASSQTGTADGTRIYFYAREQDGSWGLWWIPSAGGAATKAVSIDDPSTLPWDVTVGAHDLYLTLKRFESDIWVMDLDW